MPARGDLRAPREALLAAADHVVALGAGDRSTECPPEAMAIPSRIAGAIAANGERWSLADLARHRCGLFVTIARPSRIEAALRSAAIEPRPVIALADHAIPPLAISRARLASEVDAWLTTARCAVKLPAAIGGAPVLTLEHQLDVTTLCMRLSRG